MSTVIVMWTAPSPPPTDGYQVQITRGSTTTTVNVAGTSHTFSVNNQYGVHSIEVRSLSRHFQSNMAAPEPVEITVRGMYDQNYKPIAVCHSLKINNGCMFISIMCLLQELCHQLSLLPHPLPHQSPSPGLSLSSVYQ